MIWFNSKYSRVVCKQEWVYDCKHKEHKSKGGPWGTLGDPGGPWGTLGDPGRPWGFLMNDFMDGMVLEETRT